MGNDEGAFWLKRSGIPQLHKEIIKRGGELRAVGGSVRDVLMGQSFEYLEIDFASDLTPDILCQVANSLNLETRLHGYDYGTVMFIIDGEAYEVTSLRRDVKTFGRQAEVEFGGDWSSDAHRRDFTMNALSMDSDGLVHDYCDGLKDLLNKKSPVIRFVGDADKRVREDYLRILRFFRMYAQIPQSRLDECGFHACHKYRDCLVDLSVERKRDELLKLLAGEQAYSALSKMHEHGILSALGLHYNGVFDKVVRLQKIHIISGDECVNLYLILLMGESDIKEFAENWRLDNNRKKLLKAASFLSSLSANEILPHLNYYLYKYSKPSVRLAVLYLMLSLDKNYQTELEKIEAWSQSKLPINGDDIAKELGVTGVTIGDYLDKALRHWCNASHQPNRSQLLEFLRSIAGNQL